MYNMFADKWLDLNLIDQKVVFLANLGASNHIAGLRHAGSILCLHYIQF